MKLRKLSLVFGLLVVLVCAATLLATKLLLPQNFFRTGRISWERVGDYTQLLLGVSLGLLLFLVLVRHRVSRWWERVGYLALVLALSANLWEHVHARYLRESLQLALDGRYRLPLTASDHVLLGGCLWLLASFLIALFRKDSLINSVFHDPAQIFLARKKHSFEL